MNSRVPKYAMQNVSMRTRFARSGLEIDTRASRPPGSLFLALALIAGVFVLSGLPPVHAAWQPPFEKSDFNFSTQPCDGLDINSCNLSPVQTVIPCFSGTLGDHLGRHYTNPGLDDWCFREVPPITPFPLDYIEYWFWSIGGNQTGDPTDGYVRFIDPSPHGPEIVHAPDEFLGDWSKLDGQGQLCFDMRGFQSDTTQSPVLSFQVEIHSETIDLTATWEGPLVPCLNFPNCTFPWRTIQVPIDRVAWGDAFLPIPPPDQFTTPDLGITPGTTPMVPTDWMNLLTDVTDLRIWIELYNNSALNDERIGLDNVVLGCLLLDCQRPPIEQPLAYAAEDCTTCQPQLLTALAFVQARLDECHCNPALNKLNNVIVPRLNSPPPMVQWATGIDAAELLVLVNDLINHLNQACPQ